MLKELKPLYRLVQSELQEIEESLRKAPETVENDLQEIFLEYENRYKKQVSLRIKGRIIRNYFNELLTAKENALNSARNKLKSMEKILAFSS